MAVEHMVWIRFKPGVDQARQTHHLAGLAALKDKVPGIERIAIGQNFTNRAEGYTHGLLVTLVSREALKFYADHPDHLAVSKPLRDDADLLAMDIET